MMIYLFNSIKLYAWEYAFVRKILSVRNHDELKMLKKIGIVTVRSLQNTVLLFNADPNRQSLNTTLWGGIPCMQNSNSHLP
jgi:hypothetical protein